MSTSTGTVQSVGAATAIVVVANLAIYFLPIPIALVIAGGAGDLARWYTDGGYFMHMVTLLAMAQLAAGIVLGILHLHRPLPMVLYLIVPACVALAGIAGTAIGTTMAYEAVATAPPDMKLQMWAASLSIAGVTRQYGLAAASLGCLSMVIGSGMGAFVRRGLGAPGRGAGAGLLTAGVGVATAVGAVALLLVMAIHDLGVARPVVLASFLLFGTVFAALGTRGIAALAQAEGPEHKSLGFSMALTCAVGLILAIVTHGLAMIGASNANGLEAIATAPPDMKTVMVTASIVVGMWSTYAMAAFAVGAALVAGALLVAALPGLGPWISRRASWAGAGALLVIAVIGADAMLALAQSHRHESMVEQIAVKLPDGVRLPTSSSDRLFDADMPVVGITTEVVLDGNTVGRALSPEGRAALSQRLTIDAPEEPSPVERFIPSTKGRPRDPEDGSEGGLLDLLRRPTRHPGGPCGRATWGPFAITMDGAMTAEQAWRQTEWLRDGGACQVRLLTEPKDGAGGLSPEGELLLSRAGPIGDLLKVAANQKNTIALALAGTYPMVSGSHPPLSLTLTVAGGQVSIAGSGGTLDPPVAAAADGQVDQGALQSKLIEIKDAFPDESRVYISYSGTMTRVQHLVDAMDAAREVHHDEWDTRPLFDEPIWIGTTSRVAALFGAGPPTSAEQAFSELLGTGGGLGIIRQNAPVIDSAMPKEAIKRVINRASPQVRYCYEKALTRQPNLAGRVDLKFIIAATGNVAKAQVESSTLGNGAVEKCMLRVIRRLKFPKPKGGGTVEIRYPFIFKTAE